MDSISSWFPPTTLRTFSTMLSHRIPARPFVTFSYTSLSAMAGNVLFGMLLTLGCHFNFITYRFALSGYVPSSTTILLVVREHPSIFLAEVICTVSSHLPNFAFPSPLVHILALAQSHSLIHLFILVSRCESVRTASCLRVLYLPITFAMCASREQSLETSTPTYVHCSAIGNLSSPHFHLNVTGFTLSLLHTTTAHFCTFAVTLHFLVYCINSAFSSTQLRFGLNPACP